MKLGIFDSGLGGLFVTRAIRETIPDIDILYVGDTLRLPYGNRSDDAIYIYTRQAVEYMFAQGCALIVIACNTASAAALRRLQQVYLPGNHEGRNIIGVVVPTLEVALERGFRNLGLIATNYIVHSDVYRDELMKISPGIKITQQATPLLVPLIENDGDMWIPGVMEHYLVSLLKAKIECLLLGCTHYPILKEQIRHILGPDFPLISQDEIIPGKLVDYLRRHPEYDSKIGRSGRTEFFVSDLTENYQKAANRIYGRPVEIRKAEW